MKALVTGSAGFIGRHFSAELLRRNWEVRGRDVVEGRDALDYFVRVSDRFDLVVHAAARSPHRAAIDGDSHSHIYNQHLDAAMFDWAVRTRTPVLYLSSCAVLDDVPDAYGLLKLTGERMAEQARAAGIEVTVVRPYSGYGEDQDERFPFGAFVARAKRREDPFVIWGDGTQVRDWIHVSDVVNGALAVAEAGTDEAVSLCTGRGVSMLELARYACLAADYPTLPSFELHPGRLAGVPHRVGDPSTMTRWYTAKVGLEEGVRRAFAA